jgi:hypothetical protein
MLPGHGSAFLQLPRRRHARFITPLRRHTTPIHTRGTGSAKTRGWSKTTRVYLVFEAPSDSAVPGTNKYDPKPPHAAKIRHKNAKTPPASPECASALPGDVGDDRARIMRPISTAPTPRESNGLPGEFQEVGAREVPDHRVVKNHPRVLVFKAPQPQRRMVWNEQRQPQPPHAVKIFPKNAKTPPASPECASALPGDVSADRAHICARFRRRQPPGSPMGLPGRFQVCRMKESGRYTGAARIFCARSVGNYIICIVEYLGT